MRLTQDQTDALNSLLERSAQRLERKILERQSKGKNTDQDAKNLTAILEQLRDEPRDE